jgi:hypothetical protein
MTILKATYLSTTKNIPVFVIPEDTVTVNLATSINEIQNPEIDLSPNEIGDFKIYPNPFTSSVTIQYRLSQNTNISLRVFDIYGKLIAVLQNSKLSSGEHKSSFDGSNLSSGVYVIQLKTENQTETRKIVLMK